MKLLIVTQKIDTNDPILGFFVRWTQEFAKHWDHIHVICLEEGQHKLPSNVEVHSLGKEKYAREEVRPQGGALRRGRSFLEERVLSRFAYIARFYALIWKLRNSYDAAFVHMNPIYILLGAPLWRLQGKRVALWYVHKSVTLSLRIATLLAHVVFSASYASFRVRTKKLHVLGHGIDVEQYERIAPYELHDPLRILHIGRISSIKNIDTIIEAARILRDEWGRDFHITFVGTPVTPRDIEYNQYITELIEKHRLSNHLSFIGNVPNDQMHRQYQEADITINAAQTGGIDKVVLESMAAGVPVLASYHAYAEYFGDYSDQLLFEERNPRDLAHKLKHVVEQEDCTKIGAYLGAQAADRADISTLISRITKLLTHDS